MVLYMSCLVCFGPVRTGLLASAALFLDVPHSFPTLNLHSISSNTQNTAGGCLEDCSYCSQSTHHKGTPTKATPLVKLDPVIEEAKKAKANGSTRFCMGAAWRGLEGRERGFERILSMVREVRGMGMEGQFALV